VSAARYDITSYSFDPSASYFPDTNVWFLVYGPSAPGDPRAIVYSGAVKRLRASGATVLIDALVMSEFANAWARFDFKRSGYSDFKRYRNSAAFKPVALDIAIALRSILTLAKPANTAFANIHIPDVVATFEKGNDDFNDLLIVETCRIKSCLLVTDDGDMKRCDLPIVTANQLILTPWAHQMEFELQPTLTGELLELRPLREDDFDALFAAASDPLIWELHPERERYQRPVFQRYFDSAMASGGAFAIIERASGRIIGSSRYWNLKPERSEVEIGWTFLERAFWGGRYNGELKSLMIGHAFRFAGRVVFVIGKDNHRSRKAVEKIGGVLVKEFLRAAPDGSMRDNVVYAITRP
jgi:RimJ/RimL family protein N-acetyltransferase